MDSPNNRDGLNRFRKVGVIGGGASGLVAARELKRHGFLVIVYERNDDVGGIWLYDPRIEDDDLLGLNPNRKIVSSSLYASLRVNLPREIMGFMDYPFVVKEGRDCRRFPGHQEVQLYLSDFARDFNLLELVKFSTEVVYVGMMPEYQCHVGDDNVFNGSNKSDYQCETGSTDSKGLHDNIQWVVRSCKRDANGASVMEEEVFDAVVICNGHHTQPRSAQIPGMDKWPGKQLHSHNYRIPDPFQDQVVVVIGNSSSGEDVSRELARFAKEVHVAAKSVPPDANMSRPLSDKSNIWLHPVVESVYEDGTVTFQDGVSIFADAIIHCTGYSYKFPFLDTNGIVKIDDNCVGPLYEHVFPPLLAPSLSFVGLPWKIIPFPLLELQSRWIACVLSGKVMLPSAKDMMEAVTDFYHRVEAAGLPKRYTHNINHYQFDYDDWLADQCGCGHVEDWRKASYTATQNNRRSHPDTYRDEWTDHHWHEIALSYFTTIVTKEISELSLDEIKDQKGGGCDSAGIAL